MSNAFKTEPSLKNKKALDVSKKMGRRYSLLDAMLMGRRLGIDWKKEKFTVGDLLVGMHYELEHGKVDPETNVTNDSPKKTAKIAWAHLKERPDYYVQLMKIDPPKKIEKTAHELLDELVKEAAYLKDINCERCGFQGQPDPDGTCPDCGAIGGHNAIGVQKKYEKTLEDIENSKNNADDDFRQEQERIHSMMIGG